jgi:putative endonuclease
LAFWDVISDLEAVRDYYVYILTNHSGTLYIGMASDLERRLAEHRLRVVDGFAKRYRLKRLVYFEQTSDVHASLAREMQLKGWTRRRKTALIRSNNPDWSDLAADW